MNYTIVYKIIIGLFSVVAVVLMTLSMFFELGLETQKLLEVCDVILCTVFFWILLNLFTKQIKN
jgi:hypothetical protein